MVFQPTVYFKSFAPALAPDDIAENTDCGAGIGSMLQHRDGSRFLERRVKDALPDFKFLWAITNLRGGRRNCDWSGVPIRLIASRGIRDCRWRGVPARRLTVRFASDECEEIGRDQVFLRASSLSRAADGGVRRNAVRRNHPRQRSSRCLPPEPLEYASRSAPETAKHISWRSLPAGAGFVPTFGVWSPYPEPVLPFRPLWRSVHHPKA